MFLGHGGKFLAPFPRALVSAEFSVLALCLAAKSLFHLACLNGPGTVLEYGGGAGGSERGVIKAAQAPAVTRSESICVHARSHDYFSLIVAPWKRGSSRIASRLVSGMIITE